MGVWPQYIEIYKNIGETPLQALERFRSEKVAESGVEWQNVPMTYAGRLDPMAEGLLLILIGDECKNKEKYLSLDKEYEVEILFGIETDTYDILGIATDEKKGRMGLGIPSIDWPKYRVRFTQEYPPFSSKTVKGNHLHELARRDDLPEEMPTKEVEIYKIKEIEKPYAISTKDLLKYVRENIALVQGDFRQVEILKSWKKMLGERRLDHKRVNTYSPSDLFPVIKILVKCSSGTYMRSLSHRIGKDTGTGAIALSIKRTKIFTNKLTT